MPEKKVTGNKSDVRRLMRRMDSGATNEIKREKRIVEKARQILKQTDFSAPAVRRMDAKLNELRQKHSDGWMNFFTGLNVTGTDKRTGARVYWQPLEEVICEQTYGGDKIARRLVEMLPNEGMREWITLQGLDPIYLKKVNDDLNHLKLRERFKLGWYFARLYGGAGTLVNVDDGQQNLIEPLILEKVKSIKSLWTFGRYELEVLAADVEYDLDNPNFGLPNLYMLVPRNRTDQSIQMQHMVIKFHHSRIIRWNGAQLPRRTEITNRYWGDSVLSPFIDSLRDYKSSVGSIAHILQDFNVWVTKIKGLADAIANGNEELIQKRMNQMNLCRSVLGAILLDADEEEAVNLTREMSGIKDAMEEIKSDIGSSQDAPRTRLFNEATPGKLGSEDDQSRQWYDFVHSQQEEYLRPNLLRFFEVYQASQENSGIAWPEEFAFLFNSLWQQTDKETAETRKATAEADQIYLSEGVLSPQEVRDSRFGGDEFSQETTLQDAEAPGPPVEPSEEEAELMPGEEEPKEEEPAISAASAPGGAPGEGLLPDIKLPANRDQKQKMHPPSEAGEPGTYTSPEAMAIAASGQSSLLPAKSVEKDQFGKQKREQYVKNLYSTFIQDGKKMFRVDGEPMRLVGIHVAKDLARTKEDAAKVAKAYERLGGFVYDETPLEHRFRRTFKKLGPINMSRFVIKRNPGGMTLIFSKI